jgi:hypothetical protein
MIASARRPTEPCQVSPMFRPPKLHGHPTQGSRAKHADFAEIHQEDIKLHQYRSG